MMRTLDFKKKVIGSTYYTLSCQGNRGSEETDFMAAGGA
jgi:hypothetical protein